ncbi:pectin acetylesterase 8-like protein isoform X1, partial [Tanacetum coccineum]
VADQFKSLPSGGNVDAGDIPSLSDLGINHTANMTQNIELLSLRINLRAHKDRDTTNYRGVETKDMNFQSYCRFVVGEGINNWGGWCNNATSCLARSGTRLGSSKKMVEQVTFSGILHNQPQYKPGSRSYIAMVHPLLAMSKRSIQGARIFRAVVEELLEKGVIFADNAIHSGCSAGGLTSILHCDNFKALLPTSTRVKCLANAGYFINTRDIFRIRRLEAFYDEVVKTHGSAKNLPRSCTSKMKNMSSLCFFPENMIYEIKTPIFLTNAAYDSWQIKNALAPGVVDPHGSMAFICVWGQPTQPGPY